MVHRSKIRAQGVWNAIWCITASSLLTCLLITFGCARKNGHGSPGPSSAANVDAQPDEPIVVYEKATNAFGTSDAYTLTIYLSGKLTYQPIPVSRMPIYGGDEDKKKEVPVETTISPDQLHRLLDEFYRANFMSMRDSYATTEDGCPRVVSDQGGTSITFNGKAAQKKVDHYLGCVENGDDISYVYPAELRKIESRLDDLVPKQP